MGNHLTFLGIQIPNRKVIHLKIKNENNRAGNSKTRD